MVNDIAVQDFVNAIKEQPTDTNRTYNATVSRIDNEGVVWVNIHGSDKETPTASTSTEVKRGDAVTVNWRNNKLYIGGNTTNPSVGVGRMFEVEQDMFYVRQTADSAFYEAGRAGMIANNAMVSANGKNSIYRQATQPSGSSFAVGDVWFDTANDNQINRWDGTTWVAFELGDDALESLSASKLTAGEIDASVITVSNIDAGNITAGNIGADYMAVNSINAINNNTGTVKIRANKVEIDGTAVFNAISSDVNTAIGNAVDDIEIGGRNLLQRTSDYNSWTFANVTVTDSEPTDILNYAQISSDASSVAVCQYRFPYSYIRNKTITMSCMAKATASTDMEMFWEIDLHADTTSGRLKYTTPNMDFTATGNWQKVSRTLEVTDSIFTLGTGSPNYDTCYARILLHRLPACHSAVQIKELKLEIGNKATDWSPAPEDTDASIAAVASAAASKSDAVARSQRIYWRATSASGKPSKNTTWLSTSGTGYGNWSLSIPQMTSGSTKYPFLYTAVQTQTVAQMSGTACSCSDVLLDETTTVIDGGTIITGTVHANAVSAEYGEFDSALIPNLSADKITTDTISIGRMPSGTLNSEIEVGGRNLILNTAQQRVSPASSSGSAYPLPYPTLSDYGINTMTTAGEPYTYSFDYTVTGNSADGAYIYVQLKGSVATDSRLDVKDAPTGHYSMVVSPNATQAASTSISCSIRLRDATDGAVLTVSNIKLEKGTKETDWTPAPEDVDALGANLYALFGSNEGYLAGSGTIGSMNATRKEHYSGFIPVEKGDTVAFQMWVTPSSATSAEYLWMAYELYNSSYTYVGSRPSYTQGASTGTTQYHLWTIPIVDATVKYIRVSGRFYSDGRIVVSKLTSANITTIDGNGIRVHAANNPTINYAQIDANGLEVYKGGESVALYGDAARVGKATEAHTVMSDTQFAMLSDVDEPYFSVVHDGTTRSQDYLQNSRYLATNQSDVIGTFPLKNTTASVTIYYEYQSSSTNEIYPITLGTITNTKVRTANSSTTFNVTDEDSTNIGTVVVTCTQSASSPYVTLSALNSTSMQTRIGMEYTRTAYIPKMRYTGDNNLLWSGVKQMSDLDSITLAEPVSQQITGITLVWAKEDFSAPVVQYVPKTLVRMHATTTTGVCVNQMMVQSSFSNVGTKTVYITDKSIYGHSANAQSSGSGSSISPNHSNLWYLWYVFGM